MSSFPGAGPVGDIDIGSVDVVVVGGGPVGLAAALDLGVRGVSVLLVDEGDGVASYPTAESIDTWTMEWLRRLGINEEVQKSGFPDDYPRDIAFVTRLAGHELARFRRPDNRNRSEATVGLSPEGPVWWPKFWFDTALREKARRLPNVTVRYQWRCDSVAQSANDVVARLRGHNGAVREVRSQYLVACDGARSGVRRELGIQLEGSPAEARWQGAFVEIPDLVGRIPLARAVQYYVLRPRRLIFGALDGGDLWRVTYPLSDGEVAEPRDVIRTIREASGLTDLDVHVRDTRPWTGHTVVASSYRRGRIFLAGDAAHQMWPSGGHGMNTGIGDVSNLGWKLELAMGSRQAETLLDSYEAERKPVAVRNTNRAAQNYQADLALPTGAVLEQSDAVGEQARIDAGEQIRRTREREWRSLGIQLGFRYETSPIIAYGGGPEPRQPPESYAPTVCAGHRAPDSPLADGRTLLDVLGPGFTLVGAALPEPMADAWREAFAARGLSLRVAEAPAQPSASPYSRSAALVRPDALVAWSGECAAAEIPGIVDVAVGHGQRPSGLTSVGNQRSGEGGC